MKRFFLLLPLLALGCAGARETADDAADVAVDAAEAVVEAAEAVAAEVEDAADGYDATRWVPAWVQDAVFYQLFPERFRNGDASNDPTFESLEFPEITPRSWAVTPWTSDWYARPPWEREMDENFYQGVFHRRYGGDLQGVLDGLDYLDSLGVNVIYFNPVFWARSLHKYDGNSFHHVDPHFGPDPEGDFAIIAAEEGGDPSTWQWTAADRLFLEVVEQAHARGIRVVIDGVFNHTGRDFFAFDSIRRHGADSPYADWYIVNAFDDPATDENEFEYEGWWGVETLPVFADTPDGTDLHPGPKQYVMDATARWMDPDGDGDPGDGIDGWRLDVANEVPVAFWADWNAHVRELNPEAYTVAEIWEGAEAFLRDGRFSATMNYHGFAFPVKGFLVDGRMAASDFAEQLEERREAYPPAMRLAHQNLVDSHDTDRLASMIVNADDRPYLQPHKFDYDVGERVSPRHWDQYLVRAPNAEEREIQKLVALMQMTYVGAPMIYYGTEAGMWGADDPGDRKPMVWPHLTYDDETADPLGRPRTPDPVAFDAELYAFYQDVIGLRHAHPALRSLEMETLLADDAHGLLAFSRGRGADARLVVFNRSAEAHSLRIELPGPLRGPWRAAFSTTDGPRRVQTDETAVLVEIAPRTGLVLGRVDR